MQIIFDEVLEAERRMAQLKDSACAFLKSSAEQTMQLIYEGLRTIIRETA